MGVWIETIKALKSIRINIVTPCVGVWIETSTLQDNGRILQSHPAWVCGLKLSKRMFTVAEVGHTLRGCVD